MGSQPERGQYETDVMQSDKTAGIEREAVDTPRRLCRN